ncbi:TonB-dependent receptor [Flammeovirgaceae bacterium]
MVVSFKHLTLLVSFLVASNGSFAQNLLLSGKVFDRESKIPLVGANLSIRNSDLGISTDSLGQFGLYVNPGSYVLSISYVGYKSRTISLQMDQNRDIRIVLTEDIGVLNEVSVSAEAPDKNILGTDIGVNKINIGTISKLPTFMGEVDVVKSVMLLPGVTNVGEGASGINVRGGNTDQNLILMDDAPFFNSGHLLGFFSVFNPDVVKDLTLYKGGIPAKYGGRVSSVLDIKLKNPETERWSSSGGIGLVANRLLIEGPIIENKLSILTAARISYPDYLFRISSDKNIKNTKANFYDLTTKLEHQFSEKSRLSFTGYLSKDNFKLSNDSLANIEINATSSKYSWQTSNATIAWQKKISEKLYLRTSVIYGLYKTTISSPDSSNAFRLNSDILYQSLKTDWNWYPTSNHEVDFGFAVNPYNIRPGTLQPNHSASSVRFFEIPRDRGIESGVYASDQWEINDIFSVQLGARYVRWNALGRGNQYSYMEGVPKTSETIVDTLTFRNGEIIKTYSGVEPRISVKMNVGVNSSIKLNYNKVYQFIQQVSNTTSAMPTDRWQLSNNYIKPQYVKQVSLGYFRNFMNNAFETSAEFYYKDISNATDYKDGVNLLLNPLPETAMLQGKGRSYGAELYIKKIRGLVTGWLSYTYSQTHLKIDGSLAEEKINQGQWYAANFNTPNNINLAINYKSDNRVTYSASFTYRTGRPYTVPEDKYVVNGFYIPNYIGRNENRIPDYHRLDLAVSIDSNPKKTSRFKGSWTFSLYNVYARKNAYSVFFKTKNNNYALGLNKVKAYKLSVLGTIFPSVTYNFNF